jgi:hypothetical protein
MSLFSDIRDFRDSFRVMRVFVRMSRDLSSIASTLEAFRLHFDIKSVSERETEMQFAESEAAKIDKNPELARIPSQLELALEDIRDRKRQGQTIDEEEILAAAQAMDDDEDRSKSVW